MSEEENWVPDWKSLYQFILGEIGSGLNQSEKKYLRCVLKKAEDTIKGRPKKRLHSYMRGPQDTGRSSFH